MYPEAQSWREYQQCQTAAAREEAVIEFEPGIAFSLIFKAWLFFD